MIEYDITQMTRDLLQISEWLYQSHSFAINSGVYQGRPIRAFICVNENNERHLPLSSNDMNYLWCSFNDPGEQLTTQKLKTIVEFARTFKEDGVVVYCFGGINRSPLICAYLLHVLDDFPPEKAYHHVSRINRYIGIRQELKEKIYDLVGFDIRSVVL